MPCLKRESCSSRRPAQTASPTGTSMSVCPPLSVCCFTCNSTEKHLAQGGVEKGLRRTRSRWRTCSYIRLYANERVRWKLHNKRVEKGCGGKGKGDIKGRLGRKSGTKSLPTISTICNIILYCNLLCVRVCVCVSHIATSASLCVYMCECNYIFVIINIIFSVWFSLSFSICCLLLLFML